MSFIRPVLSGLVRPTLSSLMSGTSISTPDIPYLSTGLLEDAVARLNDVSGWETNPAIDYDGGKATVDGSQVASLAIEHALPSTLAAGNEIITYAHARTAAGTIKTRLVGDSAFQSNSAGTPVKHVQRRTAAGTNVDEFGFIYDSNFTGEVRDVQIFDIQGMLDGPLDIYILAGQSNMEGGSALTGYDPDLDYPEFRALAVTVGDGGIFGWETDETGTGINAGAPADSGIGHPMFPCEPIAHAGGNTGGVSPATSIARAICNSGVTDTGRTAIFLCCAMGGSDLRDEWDTTASGTAHDLMSANIDALLARNGANAVKGMFWCQGESSVATDYAADFKTWCETLRTSYGGFPLVVMEQGGLIGDPGVDNMIAQQRLLATGSGDASELALCRYVARPGGATLEADALHFTGTTNRARGTEAATAMIELIENGAVTTAPSVIASDSLAGRLLTIRVDSLAGTPTPSVELTTLTLDGQDVLGNVSGSGPWTYTVPDDAGTRAVAWEITATNTLGHATDSGSETVAGNITAPGNTVAPMISDASPRPGDTVTITEGSYSGTAPIVIAGVLTLDGVDVSGGMVGDTYTIPAGTHGESLMWSETASNAAGATGAVTASATITAEAPMFAVPDIARSTGGTMTVDLAAYMTDDGGDASIIYGLSAMTGISLAGAVLTFTDTVQTYPGVEVTATNSAGTTTATFDFTVEAAPSTAIWGFAGSVVTSIPDSHGWTYGGSVITNIPEAA